MKLAISGKMTRKQPNTVKIAWFSYLSVLIACLFLLVSCSTINGFLNYGAPTSTVESHLSNPLSTSTISPNTTLAPNEFRVILAQACPITSFNALRSDTMQTGSLAWMPGSNGIAYVAPHSDQQWYNGDLVIASGPSFATQTNLSTNIQVVEDLLWSPDGVLIAFVAFRPEDNVYTVMVTREKGSPTDLFPDLTARSDKFSSPKTLLQWKNNDTLSVALSCGVDCEQAVDINVVNSPSNSTPSGQPTELPVRKGTLIPAAVATGQPTYEAKLFPPMSNPTWSPDGNLVAYLNENNDPWLLSIKDRTMYPLNVNGAQVIEMQWSPNGKMIALHLDGSIEIFKIGCTAN